MTYNEWFEDLVNRDLSLSELKEHLEYGITTPPIIYRSLKGNSIHNKVSEVLRLINEYKINNQIFKSSEKPKLNIKFSEDKNKDKIIEYLSTQFDVTLDETKSYDLLILTDTCDVNPEYYGDIISSHTNTNKSLNRRNYDLIDQYYYLPKVGFGNGGNLIAVFSGASLIQHVEGHDKEHEISNNMFSSSMVIESNHHQLINPYNSRNKNYEIIAWSRKFRSSTYLNGSDKEIELDRDFVEIEIIKFDEDKLCIQSDPSLSSNSRYKDFCMNLIKGILKKKQ